MKLKVVTKQLYKHRSFDIEGTISSKVEGTRFVVFKLTKQHSNAVMISDAAPFGYVIIPQGELIKI